MSPTEPNEQRGFVLQVLDANPAVSTDLKALVKETQPAEADCKRASYLARILHGCSLGFWGLGFRVKGSFPI